MVECGCRCQCISNHDHDHRTPVVRTPARPPPEAEAVLEGLAVGGLVAVLRQLGDLAELAAEVFDGLQDQVTAASARGRRLAARAKQLAADLPPSSTDERHHLFLSNTSGSGTQVWCRRARTHLKVSLSLSLSHAHHGVVATPRPRLVVRHIERCRGPPALSILDRFDADGGEGACLKRYTDPSFFRANFACSASAKLQQATLLRPNGYLKTMEIRPGFHTDADSSDEPPNSAHTDSKSSQTEEDASENPPSPGFLWMLRQLKPGQAAGSVFPSQKLQQMRGNIQKHESSAAERRRDSSAAGPSEQVGIISFTVSSPEFDKANENHHQCSAGQSTKIGSSPLASNNHCSDDAGSDYNGGTCGELLERTSSFEAWLSPDADARFFFAVAQPRRDEYYETRDQQEPSHGALAPATTSTVEARPNPVAAEQVLPCKKGAGNHKRSSSSRYRGSIEMIAARVSSLPRKLFSAKHQHDPLADSSRSATGSIGVGGSISDCGNPGSIPFPREAAFVPVLISSDQAVLGTLQHGHGPLPETESTRLLQCTGGPSISYDAEILRQQQQEDPCCILNQRRSSSSTDEICRDRTPNETPDYSKNLLMLPRIMQRTAGAPESPENPPSEGTRVDAPPLPPPVPPMQWLPEKVRTAGPRSAASSPRLGGTPRTKPPEVDDKDRSNALRSTVVTTPLAAETMTIQARSPRSHHNWQNSEGSVVNTTGEVPALAALPSEEAQSEISLQTQQAEKVSQEHVAVSDSSSSLQKENVFFSAVQELAKMSPPPAAVPAPPRPKYSSVLDDAGSQDHRIMLRNGPSLIHPSRNILDSRSVLLEQIKDKSVFSLKPVSGAASPPFPGSPTNSNSRAATILQRADDIRRQAHAADGNNTDDGWSDDGE